MQTFAKGIRDFMNNYKQRLSAVNQTAFATDDLFYADT